MAPTNKSFPLPPAPSTIPIPPPAVSDKLDMSSKEFHTNIEQELKSNANFPPELPVKEEIGKLGLMWPRTYAEFHRATPLLNSYAKNGCPANCGPDWSLKKILLLLRRGPHRSTLKKAALRQLRKETTEKIKHGYARVVRWGDIKHKIPPKLKISPVAMIPHKSKPYRCILDLSFTLHDKGIAYASVNETTDKQSLPQSMAQLGLCIQRMIATLADNYDEQNPFHFVKLDIKDGFWRMAVSDDDAWNFSYVLPSLKPLTNEDDTELVVPNSLQMGWCESPPFFCSGSETARDVIETLMSNPNLPHHRIENDMLRSIMTETTDKKDDAVTSFEVFVDDFIGYTNNPSKDHLLQISRAMIHGIHSIFPPPHITKHSGEDPISEGKIAKGEGLWSTEKEVLGWIFAEDYTLRLPASKIQGTITMIRKMLKMTRPSLNKYQKLAGKLQHASFGLPGGRGLFSPIQMAMSGNPEFIPLTDDLKNCLKDWQAILRHMESHPTSVLQLVTDFPSYIGYSDACGLGAGGTWSSGIDNLPPFLWKYEWPKDIKDALITEHNPTGTLTINDLELAGMVLNLFALECNITNLKFKHIAMFCDNTSAVSWTHRLRTSKSKSAARLLRIISLRLHARQASNLLPIHVAGEENCMADIVSRSFKNGKYFMHDTNIVDYFNVNFKLPQNLSWREFHLPSSLISLVISSLRGKQLPMEWFLKPPGIGKNTGSTGVTTAHSSNATLSSPMSPLSAGISSFAPSLQGSGLALTEEAIKSKFRASRTRSRPSARPSCWLDNEARSIEQRRSTT
jgi:hypothetical protein